MKGTATQRLQLWSFWNRVIPSGKSEFILCIYTLQILDVEVVMDDLIPSKANDRNEVEVDKLSKAISTTAMKQDNVPFVLFGETADIIGYDVSPMCTRFKGILKSGKS